ncbi:MAG TPA: hypothetical protein VI408_15000 [Gaiellaceae bacterium]
MDLKTLLTEARESVGAHHEYGDPYERNGVTVIPVSSVRGGGGGGLDHDANGGGGFGVMARPAGAWVIRGDHVTWKPAFDPVRVAVGAELVALLALGRRAKARRGRRRARRAQAVALAALLRRRKRERRRLPFR